MYHSCSAETLLKKLNVTVQSGLSGAQVALSHQRHGKNQLAKKQEITLIRRILKALFEPMMVILLVAFCITFGVNLGKILAGSNGNLFECLGIFIAIFISVSLSVIMEGKSKKSFEMLNKISQNVQVKVRRGGKDEIIDQSQVAVGDIIYFSAGDKVVCDARIIQSNSLCADESMLTGESSVVKKTADCVLSEQTPLAERKNMLYSGTFITAGNAVCAVVSVGDNAEIGKIAVSLAQQKSLSAPLEEKLEKLGKSISVLGALSAVLVFALSFVRLVLQNQVDFFNVQNVFIECIVLIVAAVPEGLPSTVAISMSLNVLRLSKQNALIKKLVATETIGAVSVICSDKTGTLTQNKMSVHAFVTPEKSFKPTAITNHYIIMNCVLNGTCTLTDKGFIGSVTESALLLALRDKVDFVKLKKEWSVTNQVPFSSQTKHMQTTVRRGNELITLVKGAPEIILQKCTLSTAQKNAINAQIQAHTSRSMRVIAFCHSQENGMVYDGFCALRDPLRKETKSAVEACKRAGIKVKMLTGDNVETATAIAKECGILSSGDLVLSASELEGKSKSQLMQILPKVAVIARSTPSVKLLVVKTLQEMGEVVALTGDGVNDAPALKNADIGISMGSGSEISKEASDVILLDDSLKTVVTAIEFGRNIFKNFQRFITFQLTVNLSSMCIIIAFLVMGLESPFSSTCLLWLNVIMDGPLALSLGLEKATSDLLKNTPVAREQNILSAKIAFRIVAHSLFIAVVCFLQHAFNFMRVESCQTYTVTFALFVFFQLFNAINCRNVHSESALKGLFGNKLLIIVGFITAILQILITQFVPQMFGTTALSPATWCKVVCVTALIVLFSETYKFIYRKVKKTT